MKQLENWHICSEHDQFIILGTFSISFTGSPVRKKTQPEAQRQNHDQGLMQRAIDNNQQKGTLIFAWLPISEKKSDFYEFSYSKLTFQCPVSQKVPGSPRSVPVISMGVVAEKSDCVVQFYRYYMYVYKCTNMYICMYIYIYTQYIYLCWCRSTWYIDVYKKLFLDLFMEVSFQVPAQRSVGKSWSGHTPSGPCLGSATWSTATWT